MLRWSYFLCKGIYRFSLLVKISHQATILPIDEAMEIFAQYNCISALKGAFIISVICVPLFFLHNSMYNIKLFCKLYFAWLHHFELKIVCRIYWDFVLYENYTRNIFCKIFLSLNAFILVMSLFIFVQHDYFSSACFSDFKIYFPWITYELLSGSM